MYPNGTTVYHAHHHRLYPHPKCAHPHPKCGQHFSIASIWWPFTDIETPKSTRQSKCSTQATSLMHMQFIDAVDAVAFRESNAYCADHNEDKKKINTRDAHICRVQFVRSNISAWCNRCLWIGRMSWMENCTIIATTANDASPINVHNRV